MLTTYRDQEGSIATRYYVHEPSLSLLKITLIESRLSELINLPSVVYQLKPPEKMSGQAGVDRQNGDIITD